MHLNELQPIAPKNALAGAAGSLSDRRYLRLSLEGIAFECDDFFDQLLRNGGRFVGRLIGVYPNDFAGCTQIVLAFRMDFQRKVIDDRPRRDVRTCTSISWSNEIGCWYSTSVRTV